MIKRYIIFIVILLCAFLSFSQENCDFDVIPCDFPCVEYVIDDNGCPVCECSDGWTPINEDGCYDSNSVTYSPGYQFFITECEYVTCLQVEDGWGGFLDSGIWSEVMNLEDCVDSENEICPNSVSIPSDSYSLFNDNFNQINEDVIILPVMLTGDMSISSYQFNLLFSHQSVNIDLESFGIINNSVFYNLYDLEPAISNVSNGGSFSVNIIESSDSTSVLSVAYATSQPQVMMEVLLYIPLVVSYEECFLLEFSNGFVNDEYVFPNQTNELLISNQDLSECAVDGVVCFTCVDQNQNMLCDELEISGCTDETMFNFNPNATLDDNLCIPFVYGCLDQEACNYNPDANEDDGDCIFEDDTCYVVISGDCCCCGFCDCVCEQTIDYPFICEGELTGDYSTANIVVEGQIVNCECDLGDFSGCTDSSACNYNEYALIDDSSCEYIDLVNLGDDISICEESIILDAGEGYDLYSWSTGETSQTIEVNESGNYSVQVEMENCLIEDIDGFSYLGSFEGSNYYGSNTILNWIDANNLCDSLGGHLVVIESESENNFIVNTLDSLDSFFYPAIWIGLFQNIDSPTYSEPGGGWEWVNGSPLNYVNWNGVLEPNNAGESEEYANFWINSPNSGEVEGAWNDWSNEASWWNTVDGAISLGALPFLLELPECDSSNCLSIDNINIELSVPVCADSLACNYNPDGICDNNDSCFYENSCGNCEDPGFIHSIELPFGWSLFSTYICPFNSNIESVMVDIVESGDLVIVKNEDGMVYWPEFNINGIGDLVNGKAYSVKIANESILNISGDVINYDYPISMNSGWSYLGYLHSDSYQIEDLLLDVSSSVVIVKNSQGYVYWPEFSINGIQTMNPGEGYQIKLFDDLVFVYPSLTEGRYSSLLSNVNINNLDFPNPLNTGNNMTIGIPESAWSESPSVGDKILVYDSNDVLVGKSDYRELGTVITVWGDDLTTDIKDGMSIGENFNFTFFNSEINTESKLVVSQWGAGLEFYTIDGISIVKELAPSESNISKDYKLYQNTPNPFNGTTTVKFYVSDQVQVSIKLYNVLGECVKELTNHIFHAGNHELIVNANTLSVGSYFLTMNAGDFIETKFISIVK